MKKVLPLVFIIILTSSCTYLMKERPLSYERIPLKQNGPQNYCSSQTQLELVGTNIDAAKIFKDMLTKIQMTTQLTFIEEVVLWSLFQLNIRPDASSIYSYVQILYKYKGETQYLSVKNTKNQYSYLHALSKILARHESKYSLVNLASVLDRHLPRQLPIDEEFSDFLKSNKNQLKEFSEFESIYFKASQVLNAQESLPKLNFRQLILSHSEKSQKEAYQTSEHLFKSQKHENLRCNFDINAYDNKVYMVAKKDEAQANTFGLSNKSGDFFMASTSFSPELSPYRKSYLFEGNGKAGAAALCAYEKQNKNVFLLSNKERDPAQIIHQFIEKHLDKINDLESVNKYNHEARKLFLYAPERILFESQRISEEYFDEVQELGHPLYHSPSIGRMLIWANFEKEMGFISDPRTTESPLCEH